jgi:hypothetical protein
MNTNMTLYANNNIANMDQSLSRFEAMMSLESSVYALQNNYLSEASFYAASRRRPRTQSVSVPTLSPPVDASCRLLMAKWCDSLCDFCKYDRDVTAAAMSCVDRYAATPAGMRSILMDRDLYQLAVMTGLYLIAKIQQREALDPESVAKLSRGKHSKTDIEKMELEMLAGLNWRVHPPTPWAFAQELMNLVPHDSAMNDAARQRILELTKYQLEVAVCEYDLSLKRSSELAFGAILNAMESINTDSALHFEVMVSHFLPTDVNHLRDTRVGLLKVISEDARTQPMCAILRQSTVMASSNTMKEHGSSCVNSSPKSVSATIR